MWYYYDNILECIDTTGNVLLKWHAINVPWCHAQFSVYRYSYDIVQEIFLPGTFTLSCSTLYAMQLVCYRHQTMLWNPGSVFYAYDGRTPQSQRVWLAYCYPFKQWTLYTIISLHVRTALWVLHQINCMWQRGQASTHLCITGFLICQVWL